MTLPTLNPESGFARLRVDLTYDGTNFSGWAKQPNQRTIQEEFEKALTTILRTPVTTIVAGRTDAGVHAKHQVLHSDIPIDSQIDNLTFRLNQFLTDEIRVLRTAWAPVNFHARFTAQSRTYQYKIIDGGQVTAPLDRYDSVEWFRKLDINLMNLGSNLLLGEHDFFAYCKFREGGSTVKNLLKFEWHRDENSIVIGEIQANSFRYNMVRNLVGAAVCVGEGRFEPKWMKKVLDERLRVSDSYVFPAKGLTLISISYPEIDQYLDSYNQYLKQIDFDEVEG
ncbi:MAG: tRNA pseudouridine(38-40) synthase TruA [Actinobacteria bacterium]|nr:tRNA pseudouridine(38-40) synthase TruA [Actinomycetota bacterium]NCZ76916.1 tRNA pseudouridine(38-40) synthase TruA [Actinomycetota bacterium]